MKIIKKDGRIQDFDKEKIFISINSASKDVDGMILNESDINIIVKDIVSTIENLRENINPTSSYEIIGIIINILNRDGFNPIAKAFVEYK